MWVKNVSNGVFAIACASHELPVRTRFTAIFRFVRACPVGIAVSGAPIFNDQEGPNVNLEIGVIQGFDSNGAHTGPQTYHYHLEPKAISNDDEALVGVIADGFFLYGRQCYSTPGTYPTDLDASGGHTSVTQHSQGEAEYHYHIMNEFYLGAYYLLFPEDYQGTPSSISN